MASRRRLGYRSRTMIPAAPSPPVGTLLREWRRRRRLSQLGLALDAEISARHLSFLETGRARPSRDMVLRLAERLDVPPRDRNAILAAAGFAPAYPERPLAHASMAVARRAIETILAAHEPCPALAVDRHWSLVMANRAVAPLLAGVDESLLGSAPNVLRIALHPRGLAPRIVNFAELRAHLLARLQRQIAISGDDALAALLEELRGYPTPDGAGPHVGADDLAGIAVPLRLRTPAGPLSFISTITVFGTPVDLTLAELALETFFPADDATARALGEMAQGREPLHKSLQRS
ncbi:MAG: helix-turn-helix transcriptional regulator [Alphaproteobacteria bacterium]|nr:helix-turn-helix transcriptional regulator [Alphaproteobacteria bacterium]